MRLHRRWACRIQFPLQRSRSACVAASAVNASRTTSSRLTASPATNTLRPLNSCGLPASVSHCERNTNHMASGVEAMAVRLNDGLHKVIVGQDEPILALLTALFGDGHALIEGVPGTAKTLLVRALAVLMGADFRRIQFTPDLMPSDVVGTTVFNPQTGQFSTRQGPVFTNLLLAAKNPSWHARGNGRTSRDDRRRHHTITTALHGVRYAKPN